MRILFFNVWHGKVWQGLKDFLRKESLQTDIFCFLEVDPNLQKKLKKILSNYDLVYQKGIKVAYIKETYEGRSIFVKKNIGIKESGTLNLYRNVSTDAGGFQFVKLKLNGKELYIAEIHGKSRPGHKLDTKARIEQSRKILEFFDGKSGLKIIGGDFNLMPDTKSIRMLENEGYRDLIKDFNIKSTRNKISWEQFKNKPEFKKQYFADYVFVSRGVEVKSFEVPYIEISDHLPLIMEFEV